MYKPAPVLNINGLFVKTEMTLRVIRQPNSSTLREETQRQ